LYYIGKIDLNKIGKYKDKVVTDEVVLTEERRIHILGNHINDYEKIMKNINKVILNPREILEDHKNINTLLFIDKIEENNLNVIIKLSTVNNEKHPKNSVMTAWIIRESNLKKLRKKNKIIYNRE